MNWNDILVDQNSLGCAMYQKHEKSNNYKDNGTRWLLVSLMIWKKVRKDEHNKLTIIS